METGEQLYLVDTKASLYRCLGFQCHCWVGFFNSKKGRPITDLLWYDHSFWEHDKLKTYQASHGCFLRANGG